ncbi:MAG: HAMP domain-containing histidine kinase [Bacteroidetes bacterium]|nr:HAMP domain-containing histidine kinase [Bacteroidota bacterium]
MNKKMFVFLVGLMSLSLIGIIFVQVYWINTTVKNNEEQFTFNVKQILSTVSQKIQEKDMARFWNQYQIIADSMDAQGLESTLYIREILVQDTNENTNETVLYSNGVLEKGFNIAGTIFDNPGVDSVNIKQITNKRVTRLVKKNLDGAVSSLSPEMQFERVSRMTALEKMQFESFYKDLSKNQLINKRVSGDEIQNFLTSELGQRGLDIDFEYGIFSNSVPTKVRSNDFTLQSPWVYGVPIFVDNEGKTDYQLLVSFPDKKKFVLSSILGIATLSIIFTIIIILAYSNALYQLIRQRQISEIKTDFINNMTHEFKTPIATINLALDAIKNPKIIGDSEKVSKYLKMIKDENKRMHAQVENVLRISKLEKNQLDISKENVKLHDLVQDAIEHVSLIVEDRSGYIQTNLHAEQDMILANDMHFTNVIVNVLDNAIKYSPEEPKIEITTENVKNFVLLKIKDQGIGMSKAVQKRIFEKFYREHTGNVHNVKGHGLGLAYVKRIVEEHQGEIYVESEKNKGSEFIIKIPIIN